MDLLGAHVVDLVHVLQLDDRHQSLSSLRTRSPSPRRRTPVLPSLLLELGGGDPHRVAVFELAQRAIRSGDHLLAAGEAVDDLDVRRVGDARASPARSSPCPSSTTKTTETSLRRRLARGAGSASAASARRLGAFACARRPPGSAPPARRRGSRPRSRRAPTSPGATPRRERRTAPWPGRRSRRAAPASRSPSCRSRPPGRCTRGRGWRPPSGPRADRVARCTTSVSSTSISARISERSAIVPMTEAGLFIVPETTTSPTSAFRAITRPESGA